MTQPAAGPNPKRTSVLLPIDPNPAVWPGARPDELRVGPDGLPARVVKAHNVHKAHYIQRYAHTVAVAMKNKWPARAYIDTYAGPGICWIEDSGEFVLGSPLIAFEANPNFTHHVFVDRDSRCTDALKERLAGKNAEIIAGDSNAPDTIARIHAAIPLRDCLSLALLDPQGCTLYLDTIRALTADNRAMDLLINFPVLNLYRCLGAGQWHILEAVLGANWPRATGARYGGIEGWGLAARKHFQAELAEFGYKFTSSHEVRGDKRNGRLYDFVLASRHGRAKQIFDDVTMQTAHGQIRFC